MSVSFAYKVVCSVCACLLLGWWPTRHTSLHPPPAGSHIHHRWLYLTFILWQLPCVHNIMGGVCGVYMQDCKLDGPR